MSSKSHLLDSYQGLPSLLRGIDEKGNEWTSLSMWLSSGDYFVLFNLDLSLVSFQTITG